MARNIAGFWRIIQTNAEVVVFVTTVPVPDGAFTIEGIQSGSNVHGKGPATWMVISWASLSTGTTRLLVPTTVPLTGKAR